MIAKKSNLEQQKKDLQTDAENRRKDLEKKASTVGNIVDKSVPISNTEACPSFPPINN